MVLVTLDSAKSLTAATKDRVSSIVCDKNQTAALESPLHHFSCLPFRRIRDEMTDSKYILCRLGRD